LPQQCGNCILWELHGAAQCFLLTLLLEHAQYLETSQNECVKWVVVNALTWQKETFVSLSVWIILYYYSLFSYHIFLHLFWLQYAAKLCILIGQEAFSYTILSFIWTACLVIYIKWLHIAAKCKSWHFAYILV
jgi:hypothetical protein